MIQTSLQEGLSDGSPFQQQDGSESIARRITTGTKIKFYLAKARRSDTSSQQLERTINQLIKAPPSLAMLILF